MKAHYAITVGEFLVGEELQKRKFEVWIPAKDTGVDLLATMGSKILRLQVKESRVWIDRNRSHTRWTSWTMLKSADLGRAADKGVDFFVFVIHALDESGLRPKFTDPRYVLIPPLELDERVATYRPGTDDRSVYWTVDDHDRLWEARGEMRNYAQSAEREFTEFLENWPRG